LTPYVPRRMNTATHCAQGHEYAEVGRYPSGNCRACQREKDVARLKGPQPPRRFCPAGHDVLVVGRRSGNGECRQCSREYARKKYGYKRTRADVDVVCRNGHTRTPENTREVKRTRNGKVYVERLCLDCRSAVQKRYEEKKDVRTAAPDGLTERNGCGAAADAETERHRRLAGLRRHAFPL
jgi:hypothetical protein